MVAQVVEHSSEKAGVGSASLPHGIIVNIKDLEFKGAGVVQWLVHDIANVRTAVQFRSPAQILTK